MKSLLHTLTILTTVLQWLVVLPVRATVLNGPLDLVIVLDGSGNITEAGYELEKQATIQALLDENNIPMQGDAAGSVSLSILQYGYNDITKAPIVQNIVTSVVMDSAQRLNQVVQQVQEMVRLKGEFAWPGAGLAGANTVLRDNVRFFASQNICFLTGGEHTDPLGPSLKDFGIVDFMRYNQEEKNWLLKAFAVIVVDDLLDPKPEDFTGLPFGATNDPVKTADLTEMVQAMSQNCFFQQQVTLQATEVTQVVQDLDNTVRLIENKQTIVRVYVDPTGSNKDFLLHSRLRYRSQGTQGWSDWTVSTNLGGTIRLDSTQDNAVSRRSDLDATFNFVLPLATGIVELQLWPLAKLACDEANMGACTTIVTFVEAPPPLPILYFAIHFEWLGIDFRVQRKDILKLRERLLAMYPINSVDFGLRQMQVGPIESSDFDTFLYVVAAAVQNRRQQECGDTPECDNKLYYGAINDQVIKPNGLSAFGDGFTFPFSRTAVGLFKESDSLKGRSIQSHEIGHALNQRHTFSVDNNYCYPVTVGFNNLFPFNVVLEDGNEVPALGPFGQGENRIIYGWDSLQNVVLDPKQHFEVMSYCVKEEFVWASKYTYEKLYQEILEAFSTSNRRAQQVLSTGNKCLYRAQLPTANDTLIVFFPVQRFAFPENATNSNSTGSHVLVFYDDTDTISKQVRFEPILADIDAFSNEVFETTSHMFVSADCQELATRMCVFAPNTTLLGCRDKSSNPPNVSLIFPTGGEILVGSQETFSWNANDPDGDTVTFDLSISLDNGATWSTFATSLVETFYQVDLNWLGQSDQSRFRVTASDGWHTASATSSSTFSTPNTGPILSISNPRNRQVFSGEQLLLCQAFAYDLEDEENSLVITWTSDLDGLLGQGNELMLIASDLTNGIHVVEARTVDSSSAVSSSNVTIFVGIPEPPSPQPSELPTMFPSITIPSARPSSFPSNGPTMDPTVSPTFAFTLPIVTVSPTTTTTRLETETPTTWPTKTPTVALTQPPTDTPTLAPTQSPTSDPTESPTVAPTDPPTSLTLEPTNSFLPEPSIQPANEPTALILQCHDKCRMVNGKKKKRHNLDNTLGHLVCISRPAEISDKGKEKKRSKKTTSCQGGGGRVYETRCTQTDEQGVKEWFQDGEHIVGCGACECQ